MTKFAHMLSVVDSHTAGEPTRIALSGLPAIEGETMAAKKHYMKNNLDRFRSLLMQEPRGHRDMFGAVITPPVSAAGQYGIIFIDNSGYLDMCGHGTIGVSTVLIETGMVAPVEPVTAITFDTPAGVVKSHAKVDNGRVLEVSVSNVTSFLYAENVELDLPDFGRITIDISFGGNFFAMTPAKDIGIAVHPDNMVDLIRAGMQIKEAVNRELDVVHPTESHINTVELAEIYEKPDPDRHYAKNIVVLGNSQVDRSPCGTGTSAAMATLYGKGKLQLEQTFVNESILGTQFKGKLVNTTQVGEFSGVDPVITGSAYITGIQQFVVDPDDPLGYGFVL
jgi:proline racemase/trans-L-3-hydroxyproline dehydratase